LLEQRQNENGVSLKIVVGMTRDMTTDEQYINIDSWMTTNVYKPITGSVQGINTMRKFDKRKQDFWMVRD
jgi:hypothetical protein